MSEDHGSIAKFFQGAVAHAVGEAKAESLVRTAAAVLGAAAMSLTVMGADASAQTRIGGSYEPAYSSQAYSGRDYARQGQYGVQRQAAAMPRYDVGDKNRMDDLILSSLVLSGTDRGTGDQTYRRMMDVVTACVSKGYPTCTVNAGPVDLAYARGALVFSELRNGVRNPIASIDPTGFLVLDKDRHNELVDAIIRKFDAPRPSDAVNRPRPDERGYAPATTRDRAEYGATKPSFRERLGDAMQRGGAAISRYGNQPIRPLAPAGEEEDEYGGYNDPSSGKY